MIQEIRDQGGVDEMMMGKSDNFIMDFNAQFFIKPILDHLVLLYFWLNYKLSIR